MEKQTKSFTLSFLDKDNNEITNPVILFYTKQQCKLVVKYILNMEYKIPNLHKIKIIDNSIINTISYDLNKYMI